MNKHTLSTFEIANVHDIDFSYKLIPTSLPFTLGSDADRYRELQNMARKVRSETQGPAVIVTREGKKFIAIPADRQLKGDIVCKTLFGVQRLSLASNAIAYSLKIKGCSDEELELIIQFLEFEIRRQIKALGFLVEDKAGRFFFKTNKFSPPAATIEMLEGFGMKVIADGPDRLFICLDIIYRYVGKQRLSEIINIRNVNRLQHILLRRRKIGLRVLMMFGDYWYPVEIISFGNRIDQQEFEDKQGNIRNVYEYTLTETKHHRFDVKSLVKPEDLSVIYCYPGRRGSMSPRHGAASLMRILYDTHDNDVKSLHRQAILPTPKRFGRIDQKIKLLKRLTFNNKPLTITPEPTNETLRELRIPSLKFAGNHIFQIGRLYDENKLTLQCLGEQRRKWIQKYGFLGGLDDSPQYLFMPESSNDFEVKEDMLTAFQADFVRNTSRLASTFTDFNDVIKFKFDSNLSATEQVKLIEQAADEAGVTAGRALVILPSLGRRTTHLIRQLHHCLKKKFAERDLLFQSASYERIAGFYEAFADADAGVEYRLANSEESYKFESYLFYLSVAYLLVNRVFPYALEKPLNYDIYIGVDVHDRNGGLVFFYRNGENIFFDTFDVPPKNKHTRSEKLTEQQLYDKIYAKLKRHIPMVCQNPNGIILERDGRSHGNEVSALLRVINDLHNEGLLDKNTIKWAVVDVHKQSSIPLRVAYNYNPERPMELPRIGTVKRLGPDGHDAFLFNTGFPFKIRGSVRPLHLNFVEGTADFDKIIEDVFAQTMLAFTAPDRPSALPITIKLLDMFLEPISYTEQDWLPMNDIPTDLQMDDVIDDIYDDEETS
ncbi:hypothetical protein LQ777_29195 (plasmid) [Spirosoma oryzicola]|nr:hypothetical protein LQ777_29195 [Spirosoma oryzicola]